MATYGTMPQEESHGVRKFESSRRSVTAEPLLQPESVLLDTEAP